MSPRNRFAALLLLASVVLGCESKSGKELKQRPASRESSAKLALPPGGTWSSAVMVTESGSFERAYGGRGGIGSATHYYARTKLVLARSGGGEDRVPISAGSLENTDASSVLEASDRKWRLAAPSDGRGVAFAPEGVEAWRWVCCDGPRPFHCPHLLLDLQGDADPGTKGPSWRNLILEMMSPAVPGSIHPGGPDGIEWTEIAEIVGTSSSLELFGAFAGAALRERSGLDLGVMSPGSLETIQGVVGGTMVVLDNPGFASVPGKMRSSALSALSKRGSAGSVVSSNAALLLARSKDENALRALAAALNSEDWAAPSTVARDMQWPRSVAWSLARSVDECSALPGDVATAMIAFLKREKGKPEAALPIVFALAAHGSPETLKKLADVSAPDLASGAQGKPDPEWPATLDELWQAGVVDHGALTHPIDAWIRAALKARK